METQQPLSTDRRRTLLADFTSGLVVFLVALPLCLGVALASGVPPFAGILAGVIGGILVGTFSGSHTSVSGPAAGLTAVVAAQIAGLGSFQAFLLAVLLAGVLQVVLGIVRAGSIADFVPASVVKGLLAAVGIILILKQIPHLFGHDTNILGGLSFWEIDHANTFSAIGHVIDDTHATAMFIGIVSVLTLVAWDRIKWLKRSSIPAPLVVVLGGVGLNVLLSRMGGLWTLAPSHMVQVPVAKSLTDFVGFLQLPDFRAITNPELVPAILTIAIVASLETLLNVEAVDKIDSQRRVTPPNRELIAQGLGNIVAGLVGGLPVTSVIVRSSVNVESGGKTKLATIVHGLLLLLCVVMLPTWLNSIPLSCLAAILIVIGFKLAKPQLFMQMWREGMNQFLPFVITVVAIVLSDLLVGILIGLGFSLVFILRSNLRNPLRQVVEKHIGGDVLRIELANQVSFLNRVALSKALDSVPRGGHVLLDARRTDYIDADVQDLIWEYLNEIAPARGIEISLVGLKDHYEQLEDRVQYVDYTTRDLQSRLTPDNVLQILQDGNKRFRTGQPLTRDLTRQLEASAGYAHPLAIVLTGSSSRTPVELIFDVGLGDILCSRVTGNLVSEGVLGSLEYACAVSGAKLICVMGHSNSVVVRMAIESSLSKRRVLETTGCVHLDATVREIQNCIQPDRLSGWPDMDLQAQQAIIDEVYQRHLARTIDRILTQSSVLEKLAREGTIKVVGAMYDVRAGQVDFLS